MRYCLVLISLIVQTITMAQCTLTVYQRCGQREIYVFYKGGSESATGRKISDTCTIYDIPVTEPCNVGIVDDATRNIEHIWIDPRYEKSRTVTLNNCTHEMVRHDTLPIDVDYAPMIQIERDYKSGKIATQQSLLTYWNDYEEQYLVAHPDSFLALVFLRGILDHIDLSKMIKYRDMVSKNNNQYSDLKYIDTYIENYKYKSTPKLGDDFFEFQAKKVDGSEFDSKSISNKPIVMFFWYSGCGPCHRAMEPLRRVYEKYKAEGLEVISFAFDNTQEEWAKSSQTFKPVGIGVSDLVGFNSPLFLHYAVSAFPYILVFDRNKKLIMVTFGEDEIPSVETKVKECLYGNK